MAAFGRIYGDPATPAYITRDGQSVWMWRKGQRVRFLTADGVQVGPEHRNVFPAVCAASAAGWIDPCNPLLSVACTAEVRRELPPRGCSPRGRGVRVAS
jgi:hypothetical protein